jgi:hypothetical protein
MTKDKTISKGFLVEDDVKKPDAEKVIYKGWVLDDVENTDDRLILKAAAKIEGVNFSDATTTAMTGALPLYVEKKKRTLKKMTEATGPARRAKRDKRLDALADAYKLLRAGGDDDPSLPEIYAEAQREFGPDIYVGRFSKKKIRARAAARALREK